MSTTTFGAIGDIATDDVQQSAAPDASVESFDINDPRLTSEAVADDATADSYAINPPLPDGKWRAKLRQVDVKDKSTGKDVRILARKATWVDGQPLYLVTNVECQVIDNTGKFDGTKITEYHVRTLVDDRKGTSQVATLLRKLKVSTPPTFKSQMEIMDLFLQTLAGEPELVIETAWKVDCQDCTEAAEKAGTKKPKPYLVGMHRFPRDQHNKPDPLAICPKCGAQNRANARIVQFYSRD